MYFPECVFLPRIKTIHGIAVKKEKKPWLFCDNVKSRSVNGESLGSSTSFTFYLLKVEAFRQLSCG